MNRTATHIQDLTQSGLNLISQAISIYDNNLRLVVCNKRFQNMFDLPERFARSGASFYDTVEHLAQKGDYGDIADIPAFVAERVAMAEAFEPHYIERTRPNGTTISIEGNPLHQGGWVTVYTDITDTRAQEALLRDRSEGLSEALLSRSEALAQANRELQATVLALEEAKRELTLRESQLAHTSAMTPAHIAHLNADGIYTYSNRKLPSVLPGAPEELVGEHYSTVLGPSVCKQFEPGFQRVLQGDAPVLEFQDEDSERYLRVALTPDQDSDGNTLGAYILSMDVTAETQARAALTHTRRRELAAQLTSGLAHDFNNLLTVILGQQSKLADHPDVQKESETIRSAALRGCALIENLSNVASERPLHAVPVDLSAFMSDINRLVHAAVPDWVTLSITHDLPAEHIALDPGFAQDALLNLALNAAEACEPGGHISLSLRRKGDMLEIVVEDTGTGFSDDALQNAFAPFFSTKGNKIGRGLGLATVFDFAKMSGGRVRLRNRDEGGARVKLTLPYRPTPKAKPGMVLLVDDEPAVRETTRDLLLQMGHTVVEATTEAEALTLAQTLELTHVVTDLSLAGGETGVGLAAALQNAGYRLPTFVITGLPPHDPLRKTAASRFSVISKPLQYDALASALAQSHA